MISRGFPIAKEGLPFILPLLFTSAVFAWFQKSSLSFFFAFLALFSIYFFRNPTRRIPEGEDLVVSPADGKVIDIKKAEEKDPLTEDSLRVSIFLSIFDVHINRIPATGEVASIQYRPGKFLAAFDKRASEVNEQNSVLINSEKTKILINQIAGLIARRIVCWVTEGDKVRKGEPYGLIRFGSRVDIFLPLKTDLKVRVGDRVRGGETILGVLK